MPDAPLRLCRCGQKVTRGGYCPACARARDHRHGTAHARGYGITWQRFRLQFIGMLVEHGIIPACGAALPGGPHGTPTDCQRLGLLSSDSALHLDHDPPLTDAERQHVDIVCDPMRVRLLCAPEHSRKTLDERRATAPSGGTIRTSPTTGGGGSTEKSANRPDRWGVSRASSRLAATGGTRQETAGTVGVDRGRHVASTVGRAPTVTPRGPAGRLSGRRPGDRL